MRIKILEHYHGKLSGLTHLNPGEEFEIGDLISEDAAKELIERGKAVAIEIVTKAAAAMAAMVEDKKKGSK